LSNCMTTGAGFDGPEDLVISGGYAYVTNTSNDTVSTCVVSGVNGTLSACTTSPVSGQPMGIALRGSQAYISTRNHGIYLCAVSGTGTLSNCALSNGGASFGLLVQVAVH
jgi:DNA-binding beta-propeller fold protein YncE